MTVPVTVFSFTASLPLLLATSYPDIELLFIIPPVALAILGGLISIATKSPRAARFFGFVSILICFWAFYLGRNAGFNQKGIDQDWGIFSLLFGTAFWLYHRKKTGSW